MATVQNQTKTFFLICRMASFAAAPERTSTRASVISVDANKKSVAMVSDRVTT